MISLFFVRLPPFPLCSRSASNGETFNCFRCRLSACQRVYCTPASRFFCWNFSVIDTHRRNGSTINKYIGTSIHFQEAARFCSILDFGVWRQSSKPKHICMICSSNARGSRGTNSTAECVYLCLNACGGCVFIVCRRPINLHLHIYSALGRTDLESDSPFGDNRRPAKPQRWSNKNEKSHFERLLQLEIQNRPTPTLCRSSIAAN